MDKDNKKYIHVISKGVLRFLLFALTTVVVFVLLLLFYMNVITDPFVIYIDIILDPQVGIIDSIPLWVLLPPFILMVASRTYYGITQLNEVWWKAILFGISYIPLLWLSARLVLFVLDEVVLSLIA